MSDTLTQIGKYRIECELGRGGMGVVYRAFDPIVERALAIKTIRLDVENPSQLAERLKREARSVGQLEHPNIVTLYDAGEAEGLFYLAMQFIQGETLQQRIARQKWFAWKEVHDLARQICAGLGYAHQHGVVHRDIKPANIMITPEGSVKLTDFGIAKLVDAGTSSSGLIIGTPSYMSPEQALGKPVDARSDIFSLGSILYELTTGEKAFPGQNATTIIYKIVHEVPVPVTALQPGLDPALDAIVLRALAKSPDQRFESCQELAQALESYTDMLAAAVPRTKVMPAGPVLQPQPVNESWTGADARAPSTSATLPPAAPTGYPAATGSATGAGETAAPTSRRSIMTWLGIGALAVLFVMIAGLFFMQLRRPAPAQKSAQPPATAPVEPAAQIPAGESQPAGAAPEQPSGQPSSPLATKSKPQTPAAREETKAEGMKRPAETKRQSAPADRSASHGQQQSSSAASSKLPVMPQPETYDALIVSGDLAFQQGNYQNALDAYTKAYRLSPRSQEARRKIALALTLLGRPEEARKYQ